MQTSFWSYDSDMVRKSIHKNIPGLGKNVIFKVAMLSCQGENQAFFTEAFMEPVGKAVYHEGFQLPVIVVDTTDFLYSFLYLINREC